MRARPNVLLILSDEHAPSVAGFAGDPVVRTPRLDALAARSVSFDRATCPCPACTPSRMSMLCAKEPHRCAAWSNHWIIFPEHVTWPAHFANHGYVTCLVGKMHFGGRDQMNGFQYRPYGDLRHGLGHQPDPLHMFPGYANPESAGITEIPESLIQDVIVTRETLAFLRELNDSQPGTPWFVCAGYARPHSPLTAPGRYIRRYRGRVPPAAHGKEWRDKLEPFAQRLVFDITEDQSLRGREGYYASVNFLDDCIGELLEGLERDGLLDNTIVIYASDHGEMIGLYGCWGKQLYHQPSVGVPLLISGPGLAMDAVAAHPISLMDLFPTSCGLCGLPIPAGLDGIDISAVLRNPALASPRRFAPSAMYRYAVRINFNTTAEDTLCAAWRMVRDERWKYVDVEGGAPLLFDTECDALETTNLARDAEHAERCGRMRAALFDGFSWEGVHAQLQADRARAPAFLSGYQPSTPNQYMLPDGRVFDAEKSLYDSRWLAIPPGCSGGIIPQQFG
jgi:choline-sulfatase